MSIRKLETGTPTLGTENPTVPARVYAGQLGTEPWGMRAPGPGRAGRRGGGVPGVEGSRISLVDLLVSMLKKTRKRLGGGEVHSVSPFFSILAEIERMWNPGSLPSALPPDSVLALGLLGCSREPVRPPGLRCATVFKRREKYRGC